MVGTVTLNFPAAPVVNLPLYTKSLLHTSDVTLKALPVGFQILRFLLTAAFYVCDVDSVVMNVRTCICMYVYVCMYVSCRRSCM